MSDTKKRTYACERCKDQGWYWRTPEGFNPFAAGGWSTMRAMYKVTCKCPPHLRRKPSKRSPR